MSASKKRPAISDQRVFVPEETLPLATFAEITDVRVEHPRWIEKEAKRRQAPRRLTRHGKLVLLAIDHPARGVTAIHAP